MNGEAQKACVFGAFILAAYAIYSLANPGGDGAVLAAVVGAIGVIGGYTIGWIRNPPKE